MNKIFAKIENGVIIYPPKNDRKNGIFNVSNNKAWLEKNGYKEYTLEELKKYEPVFEPEPKKYSTLKVIRALGDDWSYYKDLLEKAGVIDQFFAANYLDEKDPIFQAFLINVPDELKLRLDECLWNE